MLSYFHNIHNQSFFLFSITSSFLRIFIISFPSSSEFPHYYSRIHSLFLCCSFLLLFSSYTYFSPFFPLGRISRFETSKCTLLISRHVTSSHFKLCEQFFSTHTITVFPWNQRFFSHFNFFSPRCLQFTSVWFLIFSLFTN